MKREHSAPTDWTLRFAVAVDVLTETYGEIEETGRPRNPGLAAAAFADLKNLVDLLTEAGVDSLPYSGGDVMKLIVLEKARRKRAELLGN